MRICYVLLSPTFGMHQYTADLANRMVNNVTAVAQTKAPSLDVHLVTTGNYPNDRYIPDLPTRTPLNSYHTGLALSSLNARRLRLVLKTVLDTQPDVVHFTGPHLWNVALLDALRRRRIPTIHTLHDLDPHRGARGGPLLHLWNGLVLRLANTILVHGQIYEQRLAQNPHARHKVTYLPLLHLFMGYEQHKSLLELTTPAAEVRYDPFILFFGRLTEYKGVGTLLTAYAQLRGYFTASGWDEQDIPRLVLAGRGDLTRLWPGTLPAGVEVRNHLIDDAEAVDLFRRCSLLVLPYTDGTQSALIPSAYVFRKPVVVTRVGALPEYVIEGETGFVVEPGHPASLARTLHRALQEPSRLAQMGAAGQMWYEQRRSQEITALYRLYLRQVPARTAIGGQRPLQTTS